MDGGIYKPDERFFPEINNTITKVRKMKNEDVEKLHRLASQLTDLSNELLELVSESDDSRRERVERELKEREEANTIQKGFLVISIIVIVIVGFICNHIIKAGNSYRDQTIQELSPAVQTVHTEELLKTERN